MPEAWVQRGGPNRQQSVCFKCSAVWSALDALSPLDALLGGDEDLVVAGVDAEPDSYLKLWLQVSRLTIRVAVQRHPQHRLAKKCHRLRPLLTL